MKNKAPLVNVDFFNGNIELLLELNEFEEIKELKQLYPNLAKGIADKKELIEFSKDYYSCISHLDCDFILENCYTKEEIKEYIEW